MVVSDRKKFIFVHNPKAAGSSVRHALAQYDDRDNAYWDHEDNAILGRVLDKAHITLDDFSSYADSSLIGTHFVFGFVRNPYARVWSAFNEKNKQWNISGTPDFNKFIQTELNEINIRYDWKYIHFCPQYFFFYQGGKCRADFIGRFEELKRDYARAINLAGLDANTGLPHLNRTAEEEENANQYLDRYDPVSLSIVNRLYDRDFVYFGYDKYSGESPDNYIARSNARVEWVYRSTRFIKGEEAFYASRIEKLSSENQDLNERLREIQVLKDQLDAAHASEDAARASEHAAQENEQNTTRMLRDELAVAQKEIDRMRHSLSWRMTQPLRGWRRPK